MKKLLKKSIQGLLNSAGWQLQRIKNDRQSDQIHKNPFDAFFDGSQLINVGMENCVDKIGFGYGSWHPWVETVKQMLPEGAAIDFHSSVLERFYQRWRFPLVDQVFSKLNVDEKTRNHFLKIFHGNFLPFCGRFNGTLDQRIQQATEYLVDDNRRAGFRLGVDESLNQDGTWSDRKGEIEISRLGKLLRSINQKGYKRNRTADGDILAYPLLRNGAFRFVVVSGLHRMSVLAALGHTVVTLRMYGNMVIDRCSVSSWPLVRQGVYTEQEATEYFDHQFDFDSNGWAEKFMSDSGNQH